MPAHELRLPPAHVPVPDGVDPRLARSASFWLRAYPRRWRAARGAEVLGVLADLAGPDARGIGPRAAADLVRSGWATRLRTRPPLGRWLAYRLLDLRLPPEHRPWVADDVAGFLYPLRRSGGVLAYAVAYWLVIRPDFGGPGTSALLIGAFAAAVGLWPDAKRRQAAERHLVPRTGEAVLPGAFIPVPGPRPRVAALPVLPWLVGALAVVGVVSLVAVAVAPLGHWWQVTPIPAGAEIDSGVGPITGLRPAAAVVALATLVGAANLARALRRPRLGTPGGLPPQPNRRLVAPSASARLCSALVVAGALTVAVLEAAGRMALLGSVALAAASVALLPPLTVALVRLRGAAGRGAAPDLAFVDVWRVVVRGREPLVDGPGTALEPARGVLPGAVMPRTHSEPGRTALT